jgi:Carboxypeptidase regulatory-like domain
MKRTLLLAIFLTAAILFVPSVHAQSPSPKQLGTNISGVVLDANGKPVANAAISCESSGGLRPRAVHADAKGHFVITGLKQDSYDLRASSNGAYSDWEKNIPLRKGQSRSVTLRLLNGNDALTGTIPAKAKASDASNQSN